jgi:hypothetical protein
VTLVQREPSQPWREGQQATNYQWLYKDCRLVHFSVNHTGDSGRKRTFPTIRRETDRLPITNGNMKIAVLIPFSVNHTGDSGMKRTIPTMRRGTNQWFYKNCSINTFLCQPYWWLWYEDNHPNHEERDWQADPGYHLPLVIKIAAIVSTKKFVSNKCKPLKIVKVIIICIK